MPMDMTPDEMSEMHDKMGKKGGGVTQLAQDIAQKLSELKTYVDQSDATTDKDKMQMDQLMQNFVAIVEKQLGASPGEDAEEQSEEMSQVPMQAGLNGVPMGPQTKQ